jgi:hypothetical protein
MRTIFLAAAMLLTACSSGDGASDCEKSVSRNVTLDADQADASMALAIHDCRVDVDACVALCTRVADATPTACDVHFSDSKVYIETAWLEENFAADCAIPDFATDAPPVPVDAGPIFD